MICLFAVFFVADVRTPSAAFLFLSYCFIISVLCLCLTNKSFIHSQIISSLPITLGGTGIRIYDLLLTAE